MDEAHMNRDQDKHQRIRVLAMTAGIAYEAAELAIADADLQLRDRAIAALQVENWNLKHPVGTSVTLRKDSGEEKITKTRSEAYVSDSGHAVCFFEDVSGYYLLDRATPIKEENDVH